MFEGATSFDQPLLYCNWQSKSEIFKASSNLCTATVTCGWGNNTCPTTAKPTPSPTITPSPTPAPGFSPQIDRSWDMNFLTNITVTNVANSLDAELSQSYNISNRAFNVKYYRNNCKSELLHSISEQRNVPSTDGGMNAGFLKLETTAILNSTEVFYEDRDDIYSGDNGGGYVSLCIRADLFLSNDKNMSMNFLEKIVNITVNLETASFSIDEKIDIDRTDATDNVPVTLD
jgi:hypothetical protein